MLLDHVGQRREGIGGDVPERQGDRDDVVAALPLGRDILRQPVGGGLNNAA